MNMIRLLVQEWQSSQASNRLSVSDVGQVNKSIVPPAARDDSTPKKSRTRSPREAKRYSCATLTIGGAPGLPLPAEELKPYSLVCTNGTWFRLRCLRGRFGFRRVFGVRMKNHDMRLVRCKTELIRLCADPERLTNSMAVHSRST